MQEQLKQRSYTDGFIAIAPAASYPEKDNLYRRAAGLHFLCSRSDIVSGDGLRGNSAVYSAA